MRINLVVAIILIVVNFAIDGFIYWRMRSSGHTRWARAQVASSLMFLALGVTAISLPRRGGSEQMLMAIMWMVYAYLSVYLPKLLFIILDLAGLALKAATGHGLRLMSQIGIALALVGFCGLWWGALVNRNRLAVTRQEVSIDCLPAAFDGYRIAQFSDLHTGTWGADTTFVSHMVDSINALRPDLIVFTGDIVNSQSHELEPFMPVLSRLRAPDGVISILGNHDYGDYHDWPSPQAKADNMRQLVQMQRDMGWELLRNQNKVVRRGADSLVVAGVENIGDPPFPTYGDMGAALKGVDPRSQVLLLSHNPAHWTDSIASDGATAADRDIPLTLSGHTHAMQFSLLGHSPSSYRYKTWGGMYEQRGKKLYVNIGVGTVGFPSRVGATPEITLLELKNGKRTR